MEKETLGIFLSSHPLADVRHMLRERVDCSLAELASKPDGAWVTVGGLITQAKRIRTKSGEPMMFATLDDLEGQVEMLIFNSAYASNEAQVGVDKRVIVRGRVDHKERGETKLVVQEIEPFEPTPEEIAAAGAPPPELTAGRPRAPRTRRAAEPVRAARSTRRRCDETPDRRPASRCSSTSPARPRCCSRWTPAPGRGACASAPGYRVTPVGRAARRARRAAGPGRAGRLSGLPPLRRSAVPEQRVRTWLHFRAWPSGPRPSSTPSAGSAARSATRRSSRAAASR